MSSFTDENKSQLQPQSTLAFLKSGNLLLFVKFSHDASTVLLKLQQQQTQKGLFKFKACILSRSQNQLAIV